MKAVRAEKRANQAGKTAENSSKLTRKCRYTGKRVHYASQQMQQNGGKT